MTTEHSDTASGQGRHIVRSYDDDLAALTNALLQMGGISEKMLQDAVQALTRADLPLAQAVVAADGRMDELQREIEQRAILTLVKRQPMADDLRQTVSAIRLSGDLERVGDLAKNIAKRAVALGPIVRSEQALFISLATLAKLAGVQLKDVLDAYTRRDVELARGVWERDEEIDALYNAIFRELLTHMMEDPRNISLCTHLLFCAKNIERVGDHTTNVAETVHYLVTGQSLPGDRPKGAELTMAEAEV